MRFLRLTLFAPVASWGEHAVGEVRGSAIMPSRSAVLGLFGAALGLTRDDQVRHDELDRSLGIAIRTLAYGTDMVDFHTTQNPSETDVRRHKPTTRRAALTLAGNEATMSRRRLRVDSLHLILVWERSEAAVKLVDLAERIRHPVFTLYAGRKANVLALPLAPEIVEAESLAEAAREQSLPKQLELLRDRRGWGATVAHDSCEDFPTGLVAGTVVIRRDASPHRERWQFANRTEYRGELRPERDG